MRRLTAAAFTIYTLASAIPSAAYAQSSAGEFSAGWRLLRVEEERIPSFVTGTFPVPSVFKAGWYFDVVANVTDMIGIVGDVAGHYGAIDHTYQAFAQLDYEGYLRVHTALGGVRFSARQSPRFVPFGQALIGFSNASTKFDRTTTISGQTISTREETESNTDLAVEVGGGLNIRVTDAVGIRLGGGYLRVRKETPESVGPASHLDDVRNWGIRLAAGIVIPF